VGPTMMWLADGSCNVVGPIMSWSCGGSRNKLDMWWLLL
jgi:hypothetical protein